ncbi:chitinase C-terminal domain-containing protein [Vibrio lentus]|nr:chitinase C-terminal domain-containing protein [Vibrio lentus]
MYDKFKSATPYGNKVATGAIPDRSVNITVSVAAQSR